MSRVRCTVVGSGFAGSTFAEAVRYAPDAELVVIAGGRKADELLLDRDAIGCVEMAAMVQTEADQTTRLTKPENGGYLLGRRPRTRSAALVAG